MRWGAALLAIAVPMETQGCSATVETRPAGGTEGARLEAVLDSVREALNEAQRAGVSAAEGYHDQAADRGEQVDRGEVEFLVFALGTGYSPEEASTLEMQNQVGL
jgi:hypothetical protein